MWVKWMQIFGIHRKLSQTKSELISCTALRGLLTSKFINESSYCFTTTQSMCFYLLAIEISPNRIAFSDIKISLTRVTYWLLRSFREQYEWLRSTMTVISADEVIHNNGIWDCYANVESNYQQHEIYSKMCQLASYSVNYDTLVIISVDIHVFKNYMLFLTYH